MRRDDMDHGPVSTRKRTVAARTWGGLKKAGGSALLRGVPKEEIAAGWGGIRSLIGVARDRGGGGERLGLYEDNRIDLEATAFLHGMSVHRLKNVLHRHREQTARAAYLSFALGWLFFFAWLYQAATTEWSWSRGVSILEFAPFCLFFFLMSFRAALQNYQIRVGRLASAREYLETERGFWPS